MKYHLIFTLDYELFGNGSGCIDKCLVAPTRSCLEVLEASNALLTFFVETLELAQFKTCSEPMIRDMYPLVDAQLTKAERHGHKLELHLHPQWIEANLDNREWNLALDKWRIGDLSSRELDDCITTGLDYLVSLPGAINKPSVFRAGGWAMQPSNKVLESLCQAGIQIDSTVAPGAYNPSRGDWFDFQDSPPKPYWAISDNICHEDIDGNMLEVPIATERIGRRSHLRALRENKSSPQFPEGCSGSYAGPNNKLQSFQGKLAKLRNVGTAMLDFSTLPGWTMIELTERYMQRFRDAAGPIPIVAIGHNKNFTQMSADNLETFLDWASTCPDITFSTYDKWLTTMNSSSNGNLPR